MPGYSTTPSSDHNFAILVPCTIPPCLNKRHTIRCRHHCIFLSDACCIFNASSKMRTTRKIWTSQNFNPLVYTSSPGSSFHAKKRNTYFRLLVILPKRPTITYLRAPLKSTALSANSETIRTIRTLRAREFDTQSFDWLPIHYLPTT